MCVVRPDTSGNDGGEVTRPVASVVDSREARLVPWVFPRPRGNRRRRRAVPDVHLNISMAMQLFLLS